MTWKDEKSKKDVEVGYTFESENPEQLWKDIEQLIKDKLK